MYTLNYYFNIDDRGPHSSERKLSAARKRIMNNANSVASFKNVAYVEKELNNFFYPKIQDTSQINILQTFNSVLTQTFWDEWAKRKDFVGQLNYNSVDITSNKQASAFNSNVKRIELKDLEKYRNKLIKHYQDINKLTLSQQNDIQQLASILQQLNIDVNNTVQQTIEILDAIILDISSKEATNKYGTYAWKGIAMKGNVGKIGGYTRDDIKNLVMAIEQLLGINRYSQTLRADDLGEIFEWAIALFNENIKSTIDIEKQALIGHLKDTTKVGQKTYGRKAFEVGKGGILSVGFDINWVSNNDDKKAKLINNKTLKVGNVEVDISSDINPGSTSQGKADVIMDALESNNVVGASLKNWSSLDTPASNSGENRSLGETTLLYALSRNSSAVEDYMWALQVPDHNVHGYKPDGLLNLAFQFAKTAILCDIVMGTGFKNKKAMSGAIIINSRADRHIYVIDSALEIKNFLDDKASKLKIDGYDQDMMASQRNDALSIMSAIKSSGLKRNRTGLYNYSLINYLNNKKISVTINKNNFTI